MWRDVLSTDFTLTKRQLGIILIGAGVVVLAGTVVVDRLRDATGRFGTTQQIATLCAVLAILAGLTLLPLGHEPA